MYSEEKDGHLYIYHNGKLVYKKWLRHKQPSLLWNINGWPHEWMY